MKCYTLMMMQNKGVRRDRGRKTRVTGSGNEPIESRLALKPSADRSRERHTHIDELVRCRS